LPEGERCKSSGAVRDQPIAARNLAVAPTSILPYFNSLNQNALRANSIQ
jgi:hypothetical protein